MSATAPTAAPQHRSNVSDLSSSRRRRRTRKLLKQFADAHGAERERLEAQLVEANLHVARDVARRFIGRGVDRDDLEQVAVLGLLKAIRSYDEDRAGGDLLSFAVPTMRGELKRHFRDLGWTVRPPRSIQELQAGIAGATERLGQVLHREPTTEELADCLDVEPERVEEARAAQGCFSPSSLDVVAIGDEENRVVRRLEAREPGFDEVEARHALSCLADVLSARERWILYLRYFEECTQAEIGARIGVTQVQVSRLLSGALERLRVQLGAA